MGHQIKCSQTSRILNSGLGVHIQNMAQIYMQKMLMDFKMALFYSWMCSSNIIFAESEDSRTI